MSRKIRCDECGTSYALADSFSAATVRCKKCRATIAIPDPPEDREDGEPVGARAAALGGSPAALLPPARLRSRRERSMDKGPAFYTQPMFYVSVVATLLCGYFAMLYM